jgi:ribosomal protein S27E
MTAKITFSGFFKASARMNIEPGAYYLGLRCGSCAHDIAILDAPTDGPPIEPGGDGQIAVQCPRCGETGTYPAGALKFWQAATAMP